MYVRTCVDEPLHSMGLYGIHTYVHAWILIHTVFKEG